jgi:hypothetical protein
MGVSYCRSATMLDLDGKLSRLSVIAGNALVFLALAAASVALSGDPPHLQATVQDGWRAPLRIETTHVDSGTDDAALEWSQDWRAAHDAERAGRRDLQLH